MRAVATRASSPSHRASVTIEFAPATPIAAAASPQNSAANAVSAPASGQVQPLDHQPLFFHEASIAASASSASLSACTSALHHAPPRPSPASSPAYSHNERRLTSAPQTFSTPQRTAASLPPVESDAANGGRGCSSAANVDAAADTAGWGTWSSRQPPQPTAFLPLAAAAPRRPAHADRSCQVQIIDVEASLGGAPAPILYADAAVQAALPLAEHSLLLQQQQQQQHRVATTSANANTQPQRSDTDYVSSTAASWSGTCDFVPAPNCSVMRHRVLQSQHKPAQHCSSAHYEQLLYAHPCTAACALL